MSPMSWRNALRSWVGGMTLVLVLVLVLNYWYPAMAWATSTQALPRETMPPEEDAAALYRLGTLQGVRGNWQGARCSYGAAAQAGSGFKMASSSQALAAMELGDLTAAEATFRQLIRHDPFFADARAGLTALLWHRGRYGEAQSHWAAGFALDRRYGDPHWLLVRRQWPPGPVQDLQQFLASQDS